MAWGRSTLVCTIPGVLAQGLRVAEVAKITGLKRQTVYRIQKEPGRQAATLTTGWPDPMNGSRRRKCDAKFGRFSSGSTFRFVSVAAGCCHSGWKLIASYLTTFFGRCGRETPRGGHILGRSLETFTPIA
jgi:hypothetical protein